MKRKLNRILIIFVLYFLCGINNVLAVHLTSDEIGAYLDEYNNYSSSSAYIIGEYIFTDAMAIGTDDIMLASRTIAKGTESGTRNDSIFKKMQIMEMYYDAPTDSWKFKGYFSGKDEITEYDICYIDYDYICSAIKYTVTFDYGDGNTSSATVEEGKVVSKPQDPSKTGYNFLGWYLDGDLYDFNDPITKDITLEAKWEQIEYTIIFENEDGTVLSTEKYHYGDTVVEPPTPTKAATAEYTYTFDGWDKAVTTVSENTTYKATYKATKNSYTVTWIVDGNETKETYEYGATPSFKGTPTKTADLTYTYEFKGWDKSIEKVVGNITYTAQFEPVYIEYTVIFKNEDETVLSTEKYHYGDTVVEPPTPTKAATAEYTYIFDRWSPEPLTVSGDAVYVAVYRAEKNSYTITFKNEDGTKLDEQVLEYGTIPTYKGNTPTKASTNEYDYTFAGWDKALTMVVENTTYTATYTSSERIYEIKFLDYDGTQIGEVQYIKYNESAVAPTSPYREGYIFLGWDKSFSAVISDMEINANYIENTECYSIDSAGQITSYDVNKCGTNVVIPKSIGGIDVTAIAPSSTGVFYDLGITSVDFSHATSLKTIRGFSYNYLTSVKIPSSVETIDANAFSCISSTRPKIKTLDLSEATNLKLIDAEAFTGAQITNLTIPSQLETIGNKAFYDNNIETLDLSNASALKTIGVGAFYGNEITSLDLTGAVNLEHIYSEELSGTFSNNKIETINMSTLNKLTEIGAGAFSVNNLTVVEIPSSVTKIGNKAFIKSATSNTNLTTIINNSTVTNWLDIVTGTEYNGDTAGIVSNSEGNVEIVINQALNLMKKAGFFR